MSVTSRRTNIADGSEQSPLLASLADKVQGPMPKKGGDIIISPHGRKAAAVVPRTIGHRGFKAVAPENSMASFRAAVAAGVDAVETDLQLTRDGVVVLYHDATLQRCYGKKARVHDLEWSQVKELRSLREPHEPMPRLVDLLRYLDEPGQQNVWLMLDIKTHDDAEEIMERTAEAFASVPSSSRPWSERVTPCCWNATYIKLSMKYLPDFPITHVGVSLSYARCLTDVPNISFSMLRYSLASPFGARFIRDMKDLGIPVYVWTVNEESWMEWAVRRELAGVITDEVDLFHEVLDGKKEKGKGKGSLYRSVRFLGEMALFHLLVSLFMAAQWLRHGSPRRRVRKALLMDG
ncbi:PLC-like phosphodiesterase [Xylariaceae sp. FL0594]|nr:PLC-like phosphodiesterase [Xylariaceae sp. FL0594]